MNTNAPVDKNLIDVILPPSGYSDEAKARDTRDALMGACGAAARRDFPQSLWIEPNRWTEKAKENDANHTWPINYVDRFTNQNPTHECTCHSLRTNAESCRNRQRGIIFPDGPKVDARYSESNTSGSVWLSPLSVYAEANPGQWGGADVQQVLEIACRRGMLPEKIQPREYNFKHTLIGTTGEGNSNQSHGSWVRLSDFPDGWQTTAAWFKPLEVIFPESYEQAMSLVLNGITVSVGRNGHAIPWSFWNAADQVMGYVDSYNVVRYDSLNTVKRAWDGSFAIVSMTTPDTWDKPAGGP